jgi:hypothetical protein
MTRLLAGNLYERVKVEDVEIDGCYGNAVGCE